MLTRALVLWLLSERPLHGYQIRQVLGDEALGFWFAREDAAIYSCLRTLVKHGWARDAGREREGNRPPRTRYAITRKGRKHLRALLRRAWRELPTAAEPVHLALAALSELPEEEVRELKQERRRRLLARLAELRRARRAAPVRAMVARMWALTRAELEWLGRTG